MESSPSYGGPAGSENSARESALLLAPLHLRDAGFYGLTYRWFFFFIYLRWKVVAVTAEGKISFKRERDAEEGGGKEVVGKGAEWSYKRWKRQREKRKSNRRASFSLSFLKNKLLFRSYLRFLSSHHRRCCPPRPFFWPRLPELSDLFEEASGDLRRRRLAETVELH